jgi:endonuclease-3
LEHLLYACCLENASFEAADEAFARLQQVFFDWNEIRVTTVAELSETLSLLPDPAAAAGRLKRCLQSVFETHYAFDLEPLRKQNLGKAIKELEGLRGTSAFAVAYVAQHGLVGHCIPTAQGLLDVLEVLGVISAADSAKKHAPGLERAIPKAKGVEVASLFHQLGADFFSAPFGSKVRGIITEIDPQAKDRLPKRAARSETEQPSPKVSADKPPSGKAQPPGQTADKTGEKTAKGPPAPAAAPPDAKAAPPAGKRGKGESGSADSLPKADKKADKDKESGPETAPADSAETPAKSGSKLSRRKPR